ncbi:MAG TPA: hypothetical protein VM425_06050 [Myxococcota bacterium]|nr:hypothetical protein [Myxococcota bacterium]
MDTETIKAIFKELLIAPTEKDVNEVTLSFPGVFDNRANWNPLGGNESNFGVVENQQSSPIASLIEKIINSIDAILTRRCMEAGIDPTSPEAPRSMEEAVKQFYHKDTDSWHETWDMPDFRRVQAEEIQILANGPKNDTSLVVYDNGEGQHPDDFEDTFLSILRGNKNDIPFVQGKYNMGGTGAIVFCGKKRYQLIGSRRFTGDGDFGFTLVREHPMTEHEAATKKNTWYEYLKIDGQIPHFSIDTMDLGLRGRRFKTGTILKLYSYDLPSGARSPRELNQSINEFLFEPALPLYTIDTPERYPNDKALARHLFGLKRRLEQDDSKYVEESFSEDFESSDIGRMKITCYIFRSKVDERTVKETKATIQREFFKNNMAVIFSLNGQVHGHYTSEFMTRSLKMALLKNHLLIHVDCINMRYGFRKELFMASRDRLKDGEETRLLRSSIADILKKGRLQEIYKKRKDSISLESGDTSELLKSFTRSIPLSTDLLKLLQDTFKIDVQKAKVKGKEAKKKEKQKEEKKPFKPERFPSFFCLAGNGTEAKPAAKIPLGSMRSVKFLTDVEDQYFDRTHEPGELQISLLSFKPNETSGGKSQGEPKQLSELVDVSKSSPREGQIRIALAPTQNIQVDDMIQMKAILSGPGSEFEERFWVKIVAKDNPPERKKKEEEIRPESLGLPQYHLVYREPHDSHLTWQQFEDRTGEEMDWSVIMHPLVEGDKLSAIWINMDSNVLKSHKGLIRSITEEQIELAEKKYVSSVYFHTLFLFTIAKNRHYTIHREEAEVDLGDFLKDVFSSYYSEFLLNFGTEQLMESLDL